jgi:hypothetical protein
MHISEERYKKLGIEKPKDLNNNFDILYEKYRQKALSLNLSGELKFIKERGRIIIYVAL